ncbi:MAG: hypothetical protein KTR26_21815 [Flammeovirgaceae bacterium]|nr:hypothetical protein [Flammeovirgaceae bacterium]
MLRTPINSLILPLFIFSIESIFVGELSSKQELDSQIALEFINSYVENCNRVIEDDALDILEWSDSSQFVTRTFKEELREMILEARRQDPVLGIGFDPILDAQDYPDEGFEIFEFVEETGYVTVIGKRWTDFKLNIIIIKEAGKTLVDGCGVVNVPEGMRVKR